MKNIESVNHIVFPRTEVGTSHTEVYSITNKSLKWPMQIEIVPTDKDVRAEYSEMVHAGLTQEIKIIAEPKLERNEKITTKLKVKTVELIG